MSYSLKSKLYRGIIEGVIQGDTRSLDYRSHGKDDGT